MSVDIEIRPRDRAAMDAHELRSMIEGSSIDSAVVAEVKSHVKPGDTVLLILDSNHSKAHVAAELQPITT